jgi:hypothetical protein
LPSRHRNKADRFINRRGITGLVGFADPDSPIRAPLGRFWVGLMAKIPARNKNFKNTKTPKTSQIPLGPRGKLLGRAGLVLQIFFPKSENNFECGFSRVKISDFPSGDRKAKTSQTFTLEKTASKLFSDFGKETCKAKSTLPYNFSQPRPCFSHALKSARSAFVGGGGRAREHRLDWQKIK